MNVQLPCIKWCRSMHPLGPPRLWTLKCRSKTTQILIEKTPHIVDLCISKPSCSRINCIHFSSGSTYPKHKMIVGSCCYGHWVSFFIINQSKDKSISSLQRIFGMRKKYCLQSKLQIIDQLAKIVPLWHHLLFTERKLEVILPTLNSSLGVKNLRPRMWIMFSSTY